MPGNRKKAEETLISGIEQILPGSDNTRVYKDMLAGMSDKEFDTFVLGLEDGSIIPPLVVPNFTKGRTDIKPIRLSIKRNLALAKLWGHNFFERIWFHHEDDRPPYLSNEKYLIIDLPLRRQAQLLTKKISIPEDNKSIDDFTGQPTGKSKGSRLSFSEVQLMASWGLNNSILELIKMRGGDINSFNAMNAMLSRNGSVSQETIKPYGGTVKSTETLDTLLTCMHYETTLLK
jgi:hypothetical protein